MASGSFLPPSGERSRQNSRLTNYRWLAERLGFELDYQDGELSCRCPFHNDRSPSFSLNLENGLWCCYRGCGGGRFVDLVMRLKGLNYFQAREWIIRENQPPNPEDFQNLLLKKLQPTSQDNSSEVYYQSLIATSLPQYWFKRGLTWQTADRWGVKYDTERQRIVIPVRDSYGKWIGYVARNLNPMMPKYINSPGLKSSAILFGWHLTHNDPAILVEGPLDAIWLDQNLISGACALMGSNLSVEQVHILQVAQVHDLILALDDDEAGHRALEGYEDDNGRLHYGHLTKLFTSGWSPNHVRVVDAYTGSAKDFGECPMSDLLPILHAARYLSEEEKTQYVWHQSGKAS